MNGPCEIIPANQIREFVRPVQPSATASEGKKDRQRSTQEAAYRVTINLTADPANPGSLKVEGFTYVRPAAAAHSPEPEADSWRNRPARYMALPVEVLIYDHIDRILADGDQRGQVLDRFA